MGDHRADIKIEFTIHGKTYKMNSYINYFADEGEVDSRVLDFFRESWADAKSRYDDQVAEMYRREHAADIERSERAQLAALQAKYAKP